MSQAEKVAGAEMDKGKVIVHHKQVCLSVCEMLSASLVGTGDEGPMGWLKSK